MILYDIVAIDEPREQNKTEANLRAFHQIMLNAFERHPPAWTPHAIGAPILNAQLDVLRMEAISALNLDADEETWTSPWQALYIATATGVPFDELAVPYTLLFL